MKKVCIKQTETNVPAKFPEPVCFALDPLYLVYPKLLIVQINNLKSAPQIPNSHFIRSCNNIMRPISKVEAAGVVIFQKRSAKVLKFTIDDGTGVVTCLVFLNQRNEKILDEYDNLTKLGKNVKIRGKLQRMSDEYANRDIFAKVDLCKEHREIIVENILEIKTPNEELYIWSEMVRLSKVEYCSQVPALVLKYMNS